MNEKWEATKWVFWLGAILLFFTVIGWVLMPINKRIEREVLVQSHQYKQGMNERVAMFQASLDEIDTRLRMQLDPQMRSGLEAQRSVINAQLNAARRVQ